MLDILRLASKMVEREETACIGEEHLIFGFMQGATGAARETLEKCGVDLNALQNTFPAWLEARSAKVEADSQDPSSIPSKRAIFGRLSAMAACRRTTEPGSVPRLLAVHEGDARVELLRLDHHLNRNAALAWLGL